jgi:hypothetical protein
MGNEERTRALLAGAGFTDIRTEHVPTRFAFRDVDDYLRWVMEIAGPMAAAVRGLPDDERRIVEQLLEDAFVPFEDAGGYSVPGVALCAVAS